MSLTARLKEVQSVITSLLTGEPDDGIEIVRLDGLYRELEDQRIPFWTFGYSSLNEFLRTIPGIEIRPRFGRDLIYFAGKESTEHVKKLVARQRSKTGSNRSRSYSKRIPPQYHSQLRRPSPSRQYDPISEEILNIVQKHPRGLLRSVLHRIYTSSHPDSNFDHKQLVNHLNILQTEVMVRDNMVFPMRNTRSVRTSTPRSHSVPVHHTNDIYDWNNGRNVGASGTIAKSYRVTPDSDNENNCDHAEDNFEFVTCAKKVDAKLDECNTIDAIPKTTASDFIGKSVLKRSEHSLEKKESALNTVMENFCEMQLEETKKDEDETILLESQDCMARLNARVQFRLEKLIQNNPDGIRCIDLPNKYREEYGVLLDWESLGFHRISNFAAHLPHIFHVVGPSADGEYYLHNAKEPLPTDPARDNKKQKLTDANLYKIYDSDDDGIEAVPSNISLGFSNQIFPDDVMTNGESVGQISVTQFKVFTNELDEDRSLVAVRVVESFSPSFFWIHIEKKRRKFEDMMNSLQNFYETRKAEYIVPIFMLEKGLNVACMFFGKWHRAIIKAVDPQCQVTLLFYDYGTVKSYPADQIYHLHRSFSSLPAQAIPCGLYNVRPFDGDVWPKNVIDWFIRRVHDRVMWMIIGKIDTETNSMVISLTDTSGVYDFHVSDKMFEKKMAMRGNMVRIFKKNFVYQHYLQTKLGSQRKNNSITPNNVKNNTRLSSFKNSASYDSIMSSYKKNNPEIENVSGRCSKCGHISDKPIEEESKPNILKNMAKLFKNKSSPVQSSTEEKKVAEKPMEINTKILQAMREFMDGEIVVDDDPMETSSSHEGKKSLDSQPGCRTLFPVVDDIPETIPEFGTFASPMGGHGRMEPIDWNHIRESVCGNNVKKNATSTPLSLDKDRDKSLQSPSLMNIKKPSPKLKPMNQRFARFLNTYHQEQFQNSSLIFKREDQVVKSSVITPMVRRTLNDIHKPFNDNVRTIVPEDIRALLSEGSSIAPSSESERNEENSSGIERNYSKSKLESKLITDIDSLSLDHQVKNVTEKLTENHHLNRYDDNIQRDGNDGEKIFGDELDTNNNDERTTARDNDTPIDDNSMRSETTNSVYFAPGSSIMKRFGQLIKSKALMSSSDNQSTLDSDDSVCLKTSVVIERSISADDNTKEAELMDENKNVVIEHLNVKNTSVAENELPDATSLQQIETPASPVLKDQDLVLEDEEFDIYMPEDHLNQMIPDDLRLMFMNFVDKKHEGSNRLKITEIDSDEDNKSIDSVSKLDISTDISTSRRSTSSISSRPETDSDSQQNNSSINLMENGVKVRLQNQSSNGGRASAHAANTDLGNLSSDDYFDDEHTETSRSFAHSILQTVKASGLHKSHNLSSGFNLDIDLQSFVDQ